MYINTKILIFYLFFSIGHLHKGLDATLKHHFKNFIFNVKLHF
jgi:hypothetical protein